MESQDCPHCWELHLDSKNRQERAYYYHGHHAFFSIMTLYLIPKFYPPAYYWHPRWYVFQFHYARLDSQLYNFWIYYVCFIKFGTFSKHPEVYYFRYCPRGTNRTHRSSTAHSPALFHLQDLTFEVIQN